MADEIDEFTEFRLFLPDSNAKKEVCINDNLTKRSAYNGECIDVWLVAKFRSRNEKHEDLVIWKNRLSSFCAEISCKPVNKEGQNQNEDFQSRTFYIDDMPDDSVEEKTKTCIPCDVMSNLHDHFYVPDLTDLVDLESTSLSRTQVQRSNNGKSRRGQLVNESGMSTWPRRRKDQSISENEKIGAIDGIMTLQCGSLQKPSTIKNDVLFQSQPTVISDGMLIFKMTITLDCLSTPSGQICITAWVWTSEYDRMEHLAIRPPVSDSATEIKNNDRIIAKTVSALVTARAPPSVNCRQYSVGGNHFLSMKVCNTTQISATLTGSRVLYAVTDTNSQEKPDELVSLIGDVTTLFPACLFPGEEFTFTFMINMANFQLWEEELGLVGVVTWTYWNDQLQPVSSYYRLPSLVASQAAFVFSASGHQKVSSGGTFTVSYKIHNLLHDFLSIKMNWRPDKALNEEMSEEERVLVMSVINNVVCQEPSVHLGACQKGTTITYSVSFQILKPGLYELGKHMRLSLHYGVNPPSLEASRRPSSTSLGAQLKNAILRPNIFNRSSSIDEGEPKSPKLRLGSAHNTPTPSRSPSSQQLMASSVTTSHRDLNAVTPQQIVKLSYMVIAV